VRVGAGSRLGRHVGISTGLARALVRAHEAGYDAAQVFSGNPTGWRHVPLDPAAAAAVRAEVARRDITPLVIHAPYIVNMATPDEELAHKSARSLANALARAHQIGARYLIAHAGSHRGAGEEAGIARVGQIVERMLAAMPPGVELLIENSAGAGNILGSDPAALGRLLAALPPAVGACVDTAHLWGSGVDVAGDEGVDHAVEELDRAIGLGRLRVLHVNDSGVERGSYRDVHAHLGEGRIGLVGLAAWMTHPALRGRPIILETPPEDDPAREAVRCAIARLLLGGDIEGAQARLATLQTAACETPEPLTGQVAVHMWGKRH
jgi:deoxyribonuclease-4